MNREMKISKKHIYDWYSTIQQATNTKKQTNTKTSKKTHQNTLSKKTPKHPQIIYLHECLLDLLFALDKLLAKK